MKRYVPLLLDTLALLALGVWLGGLAFAWLAWSPVAHIDPTGKLQSVFAETLRRNTGVIELCGVTLAGIQWLLRRRYRADRSRFIGDSVRFMLLFAALFCAEYMKISLLPQAKRLETPGILLSMVIWTIAQAILLVGIVGLTVWLQSPRSVAAQAAPTSPRQPSRPAAPPSKRRASK